MSIIIDIFSKIRTKYNKLSSSQKKIADYVLKHPDEIPLLTLNSLSKKCNTSETTVLRFLKKIDFDSFQVFKVRTAQSLSPTTPDKAIYEEIDEEDSIETIKNKVIKSTITSINDINNLLKDKDIEKIIDLILNSERILFFGVGASHAIAMDAYHKLSRLGLKVTNSRDPHMINILSTHSDNKDLLFVISHSGESNEILSGVKLAKKNDSKVIAITSYENSTLANIADIKILSSTTETKYRSDAMVSRIIQLVLIDIIYISLVLRIGSDSCIEKVNKSRLAVAKRKT